MARAEIPFAVTKSSVTVPAGGGTFAMGVSGGSVQINIRGAGPATVFAAETGVTTNANPLTTTAEGRIDGWLDEGSYDMIISGAGITTYTQPIEVVRGDGVGRYAAGSVTTAALAAASVTAAKLAADVATTLIPSGVVWAYAGTTLPTGWVWCDGVAYNGTLAANLSLWNALGTTFGGTGQSSFKVPDLRGRVIVGATNFGAGDGTAAARLTANNQRGNSGGTETHLLTAGQLPAHSHRGFDNGHGHGVNDPGHQHSLVGYGSGSYGAGGTPPIVVYGAGDVDATAHLGIGHANVSIQTGFASIGVDDVGQTRGAAHPNTQPYQVCSFIIKL